MYVVRRTGVVSEAEIDGSDQLPWPAVVESERVQVLRMGGPAVEDRSAESSQVFL